MSTERLLRNDSREERIMLDITRSASVNVGAIGSSQTGSQAGERSRKAGSSEAGSRGERAREAGSFEGQRSRGERAREAGSFEGQRSRGERAREAGSFEGERSRGERAREAGSFEGERSRKEGSREEGYGRTFHSGQARFLGIFQLVLALLCLFFLVFLTFMPGEVEGEGDKGKRPPSTGTGFYVVASTVFLLCGIFGIAAGRYKSHCTIMAFMGVSIAAVLVCCVLFVFVYTYKLLGALNNSEKQNIGGMVAVIIFTFCSGVFFISALWSLVITSLTLCFRDNNKHNRSADIEAFGRMFEENVSKALTKVAERIDDMSKTGRKPHSEEGPGCTYTTPYQPIPTAPPPGDIDYDRVTLGDEIIEEQETPASVLSMYPNTGSDTAHVPQEVIDIQPQDSMYHGLPRYSQVAMKTTPATSDQANQVGEIIDKKTKLLAEKSTKQTNETMYPCLDVPEGKKNVNHIPDIKMEKITLAQQSATVLCGEH